MFSNFVHVFGILVARAKDLPVNVPPVTPPLR